MMADNPSLQELKRRHPEWEPWLAVVQAALTEAADPKWDMVVPACAPARDKAPLLAGAAIRLKQSSVRSLWAQLILVACRGQTPKLETLGAAARPEPDHLTLFQASLHQDNGQLGKIAEALGTDCEALQAVANLLPVPLLQACNRHWSGSVKSDWVDGYCPICGAWPAFAEVRGIERSRYLRCGRCGAEWRMHCLFCPYCGTSDHNELLSLVAENNASNVVIDACKRCLGYVKSFTTLQGSPPAKVMLDDLASVELDVVAVERGYKRPQGTGYSLNVNVAAS